MQLRLTVMNPVSTPRRRQTEPETDANVANRRRWLPPVLIAASTLLVLVAGVFVAAHVLNQGRTAQATAQQYFEALAAGDASTADALTAAGASAPAGASFLTDEVLAAASERISNVEVVAADDPLDIFDQKVLVSFSLAGHGYSEEITLSRGEPEWGLLQTWQMPRHFASGVVFSVYGPGTLMIAGLPINPDSSAGRAELFPAVYPIDVLESRWVGLQDDEVVVSGDVSSVNLTLLPTDALTAEVQRQLDAFLDECVAELVFASGNQATDCALTAIRSEQGRPTGSWEVVEYPVAAPELGGSIYRYTGGDARFTPSDGSQSATTLRGIDIARTIEVTEGTVTVAD